jgi:hypothetical protein
MEGHWPCSPCAAAHAIQPTAGEGVQRGKKESWSERRVNDYVTRTVPRTVVTEYRMSVLPQLKLALRITQTLQARAGQLVHSKERTSISACFYEFLTSRGLDLLPEEVQYLNHHWRPVSKLGRPCIILDRLPDGRYVVCFIAENRGKTFSPVGQFFGVPVASAHPKQSPLSQQPPEKTSTGFPPLQLTPFVGNMTDRGRFDFYAIPVVREKIHLPLGKPRCLVPGDLQRAVELVRERMQACNQEHIALRKEQLSWFEENRLWQYENPQEGGWISKRIYGCETRRILYHTGTSWNGYIIRKYLGLKWKACIQTAFDVRSSLRANST